MPGVWISSKQEKMYMKARASGLSQCAAAARSGLSERSGRDIEKGRRQSPHNKPRRWRTRSDRFAQVWENELKPMLLAEPTLQALTLLEYLQERYGERYPDSCLRTLQRRVREWRAIEGPAQAVIFRQSHAPGMLGLSDFTTLKDITVLIQGQPFKHLLYHFRLAYSGWSYMHVIVGGESFAALSEGLQNALRQLGGAPKEHRTDHLSAAYKSLSANEQEKLTVQYQALCEHYEMTPSTNNLGQSHENGSIESPHGHLKRRIGQAFLLRGNADFESVEAYQAWLETVVSKHNRRNAQSLTEEQQHLKPLPSDWGAEYSELTVTVTSSSTITVRCCLYTVPSRLKNLSLKIRLYDKRLCCYYGQALVAELKRVYPVAPKRRARNIDYRHVIESLSCKPQAFRQSQLRDDLLPTDAYKAIWAHVDEVMSPKQSCRFIVGLLLLAAKYDCEHALSERVLADIAAGKLKPLEHYKTSYDTQSPRTNPVARVHQHPLSDYNTLTQGEQTCPA